MVRPDYRTFQYSNELYHYGMPRRSGRYPWGSGDRPYQSGNAGKTMPVENRINNLENAEKKAQMVKKETYRYRNGGPAGNQNCQLCTWSMESQLRGLNVLPRPVYSPRDIIFTMNGYDIVKNPQKMSIKNKEDVMKNLETAGDGSRFYTHVNWENSSGGHEFITANFKGKIYIIDGQDGTVADIKSEKSKDYFDGVNYDNSFLVRLDNKELNSDILKYNDRKYLTPWNDKEDVEYIMKNNMFTDSDDQEVKHSNELYHYGMPRRSGRYPWGSGDRPYQSIEGKTDRLEMRLEKSFAKADSKTSKLQDKANRKFNKANQLRNSIFGSARKKSQSVFEEGYKLEEKKQRIEYRMSKKYDRYLKKFDKLNVEMDDELKAKGLEYYNRVLKNTDAQYKAALLKRVS